MARSSQLPIPVTVLTGFLGSGKTTLLNRWSQGGGLRGALIVINELGEVGIDHDLVETQSEDGLLELSNGCLCCALLGDLSRTLREAVRRVRREGGRGFDRVVVETTGLADPTPILHTLMTDNRLLRSYRLDGVVTTVDAVNGLDTLTRHVESVKQAALADRFILTKLDLAAPDRVLALRRRLAELNPGAARLHERQPPGSVPPIFSLGWYDASTKTPDVQRWLQAEAYERCSDPHAHGHSHHQHTPQGGSGSGAREEEQMAHRHDELIRSFCVWVDDPIAEETLEQWLALLARLAGPDLLRVKGLVHVAGYAGPWVIHGVQHLFHPPVMLPRWPSAERRTRVVFIVRDLEQADVLGSLELLRAWHMTPEPSLQ